MDSASVGGRKRKFGKLFFAVVLMEKLTGVNEKPTANIVMVSYITP